MLLPFSLLATSIPVRVYAEYGASLSHDFCLTCMDNIEVD